MTVKEAVVSNKFGLRGRPATYFIQKANEFNCSIWLENDERKVNAKSLLGVLSLGIAQNTKVVLSANGPEEANALNELAAVLGDVPEMANTQID